MDNERIGICEFDDKCQIQNCKNLHASDQGYFYKVQLEKAKHQIKCNKNCQNFNLCLDVHENERLFIQCQKNCNDSDCIFTHETNILQNEENLQKADKYKEQGNELYKRGEYQKAIAIFDKAINYNNQMSVLYSNKALCYKKLKLWKEVNELSIQALQLDQYNFRAKYLEAISIVELQKQKPSASILQILRNQLEILQFIEYEAINRQVQSFINLSNEKNKIEIFIELLKKSEDELNLVKYIENSQLPEQQKEYIIKFLWSKIVKQQTYLQQNEHEDDIPDYLTCPITFESFSDPILVDSGQTYERLAIENHTKKNGYFDPCTRKGLKPYYITNLQILWAVQDLKKKKQFHQQTKEAIQFE
ncbi:unnamed protein product [Paramecium pentaurelia]|uniref:RING-type E3 ubiquitin transferase n=1 Tax=Paramecium pentaurelia TaxID=43138 RepID=A0A8S1RZJ2_9CILI|nr:unnamed protein product [Paramecium pentaurelia]